MARVPPVQEHELRIGGLEERGRADQDAGAEYIHEHCQARIDRVAEPEVFQPLRAGDEDHRGGAVARRSTRGRPPSKMSRGWRITAVRESIEHGATRL